MTPGGWPAPSSWQNSACLPPPPIHGSAAYSSATGRWSAKAGTAAPASPTPKSTPSPRPVIVVGNLIAGGAGKTPAVIAIVRWLETQGRVPGVISRGHGRRSGHVRLVAAESLAAEVGDEPLLIHRRTGAPVAVGADRAAAAALLCQHCAAFV